MADAGDSKSPALYGCVGSTPTSGTTVRRASRGSLAPGMLNLRTIALLSVLAVATGCASRSSPERVPPSTVATPAAAVPEAPGVPLTGPQLIALESTPGSTPALTGDVEPAPAPVAGIAGTPGPSPAHGPADAPVRIYLFTDFQCPVCFRVVEPLKHLLRQYPTQVRVVFKQNPLRMHRDAARLAAASLAAFRQGKFWEFHDRIFKERGRRSDADLAAIAGELGLDVPRFERDRQDEAVTAQLQYEKDLAAAVGFSATPGLVVNGAWKQGWGSYTSLENIVKRELARAQAIAAEGVAAADVPCEATRRSEPKGKLLAASLCAVPK